MPSKVRIISRRRREYDDYVERLAQEKRWGTEREYVGCEHEDEANEVRRGLRQAGRHVGVSVRAYYKPCGPKGCKLGGPACRFHVMFSCYDLEQAREYVRKRSAA